MRLEVSGWSEDPTAAAYVSRRKVSGPERSIQVGGVCRSAIGVGRRVGWKLGVVFSQLVFNLNTARIEKTYLTWLDNSIKSGGSRTLNLANEARAELIVLTPSWGGGSLLPLADLSDLAAVAYVFRLLTFFFFFTEGQVS
ncbi:hypothetical protein J6590_003909 [Homalodisca vitripennis]|nr:hypothetical protein J6590_003909 [Homalodisca vitripennis]